MAHRSRQWLCVLTHNNVAPVHGEQVLLENPDCPKCLLAQAPEDGQAHHATGDSVCGHLIELQARAVQHLQGK